MPMNNDPCMGRGGPRPRNRISYLKSDDLQMVGIADHRGPAGGSGVRRSSDSGPAGMFHFYAKPK